MGLEKTVQKLDKYLNRLSKGKAKKIKPADLAKVERKLLAKKHMISAELVECQKPSKLTRLKRKMAIVDQQLERAAWLRDQLTPATSDE